MYSDKVSKYGTKTILVIFMAAFVLRAAFLIAASIFFQHSPAANWNSDHDYGIIARSLLAGNGYSFPVDTPLTSTGTETINRIVPYRPTAFQLPFYPVILAITYNFFDSTTSVLVIKFIQVIFSSATCVVVYLIAAKLFDRRTAKIAAFLSVIYPMFVTFTVRLYPETFFTFWLALSILSLIFLKEAPSLKNQIIVGVLIGLTLLNSNVAVPMLPLFIIYLFLTTETWRAGLKKSLLVMITALIIVSPWLIRNYLVFGEFPLFKTAAGTNFWLGNNPKATGTFYLPSGEQMESILPDTWQKGFTLSENAQDKMLYNDALTFVRRHPAVYAKLFLKRAYYFIWFPPDNLLSPGDLIYKNKFKLAYAFILAVGLIGMLFSLKRARSKEAFLLLAVMLSLVLLYSVFIVGWLRYRLPIEPYLIIFASYSLNYPFIQKFSNKNEVLNVSD